MKELEDGVHICPNCGYEQDSTTQPLKALKRHTILHGRYYIGNVIGQGGFGITYVGWDLLLEMKVAVKEYFPSGSASRTNSYSNQIEWDSVETGEKNLSEGMDRFLKEARKMAKLDEVPSIVRVRDAFGENGTAYIVMDFVEGVTLKTYLLWHGVLRYEECMKLLSPILDSLAVIHDNGFIHRDISPDNIMLRPDGSARLLDMGAAVDVTANEGHASMAVVKRNFSAPEQYMESESLGSWTDVYAMGATIYYCMTGKVVPEALEREFKKTPLYFEPGLNIPPQVMAALNGALELHAEKRIRDMREFKRRLWEAKGESQTREQGWGEEVERPRAERPEIEPEPQTVFQEIPPTMPFQEIPPTTPFMGNDDEMKTAPYTGEAIREEKTPVLEEKTSKNKKVFMYWSMAAGVILVIMFFVRNPGNGTGSSGMKETSIAKAETTQPAVVSETTAAPETTAASETTSVPETTAAWEPIDPAKYVDVEPSKMFFTRLASNENVLVLNRCDRKEGYIRLPDEKDGLPVVSMSPQLFYEAQNLKGVILPEKTQFIDYQTFTGCKNLTEIELPEGVESIYRSAFSNCSSLQKIDLPEGLKFIGYRAFSGTGILEITIPSTVDTLECGATILEIPQVNIAEGNKTFMKKEDLICKFDGELTAFPSSRKGSFVIPADFNSIGKYAFYNTSLSEVIIPGSVGVVDEGAFCNGYELQKVVIEEGVGGLRDMSFMNCENIEKITIPGSVKSIGSGAFSSCTNLQKVVIGEGTEKLEDDCFRSCRSLSEITIPASVKIIGESAFYYCDSLKSVTVSRNCQIDKTAFAEDVEIAYYD
ncbi:MAG: leucine-rich repeat protein [Enterocloster asparagiformis]|nr:leucine-rich repeat protein [Enterocloster asparagiformis]